MIGKSKAVARPRVACEIASDRVMAGRASERGAIVEHVSAELPPGALVADLTEPNLRDRNAVFRVLHEALEAVSGRDTDVIAVLPDAAARVVLLDFDSLPANRKEAEAVVRFRLKKALPFDVDKSQVSYHAHTADSTVRVVAAVALSSVVEEYESLFREAGYDPGFVMPSTLATLGAVGGDQPTLVVKVDSRTISIAILSGGQLLQFRSLENPHGTAVTGEKLAEDVYPSVVFFQDTYQLNIKEILISGIPEPLHAAPALEAQTGAEVLDLVGALPADLVAGVTPKWRMGGIVGALVS
jgi:type IV pilus assembly protein PilM